MMLRQRNFIFVSSLYLYFLIVQPAAYALDSSKQDLRDLEQKADNENAINAHAVNQQLSRPPNIFGSKRNQRSYYGFGPRMLQISRSKIPIELDLLVENDENDRSKRTFDDYGHMRFGKRGEEDQFDDYGHMRFGRK